MIGGCSWEAKYQIALILRFLELQIQKYSSSFQFRGENDDTKIKTRGYLSDFKFFKDCNV